MKRLFILLSLFLLSSCNNNEAPSSVAPSSVASISTTRVSAPVWTDWINLEGKHLTIYLDGHSIYTFTGDKASYRTETYNNVLTAVEAKDKLQHVLCVGNVSYYLYEEI